MKTIAAIVIYFIIVSISTFLLYNYFAPMFNMPELSYWQTVGLNFLTHSLFCRNIKFNNRFQGLQGAYIQRLGIGACVGIRYC